MFRFLLFFFCLFLTLSQANAQDEEELLLLGTQGFVKSVAWSPDGTKIASGNSSGKIIIWNVEQETQIAHYTDIGPVFDLAWSPDGEMLATSNAQIIDLGTGEFTSLVADATYYSVGWTLDGNYLAMGGITETVFIWDFLQKKQIQEIYLGFIHQIRGIDWSPNGRYIAVGTTAYTVEYWAFEDDPSIQIFEGHTDFVNGVAWSPDSEYLASAGGDGQLCIWEIETASKVDCLDFDYPLLTVDWSFDGQFLAAGGIDFEFAYKEQLIIWELEKNRYQTLLSDHINNVAWSPVDLTLAVAGWNRIYLWSVESE